MHGQLVPGGFEVAMTVAGTVISRQGEHGRARLRAQVRRHRLRHCRRWSPTRRGRSATTPRSTACSTSPATPPLDLGDVAEVMGGYGPTTVNLHDVFHVVEDGVVTDIWPVNPRGAGPPAFR